MATPIWKDYYVNLGNDDTYQFRVVLSDTSEVIYMGKAYRRPDATYNSVRINDICADYFENVLPTLSEAEFSLLTLPLSYDVEVYSSGSWSQVDSVEFLNDWSYNYDYDPDMMGMAFPINSRIDGRMPIVWTGLDVSQVTATITFEDGTTASVIIPVEISGDFNSDFNSDFARYARTSGSGTAVFYPSALGDDIASVTMNGVTYNVVTECAAYALYYVNAHGGWDCYLIEGNTLESDTLTRYTREVEYDNRDIQNRSVANYVNEVTKSYTFHTGWLSDDEASRMHHLVNSTEVFMYDIANDEMIPVVVSDKSLEYKTYKNQGNKLVNYTIKVDEAHHRIRR